MLTASAGISDEAANRLGALFEGAPNRLSRSAVEVAFAGDAPSGADFPSMDLNIVPAKHRLKGLMIADMDSTMITVEVIDELAAYAGKREEVSRVTEAAMRGELDFAEALHGRVKHLKGLTSADLEACYVERVQKSPGAVELLAGMNDQGAMTALVSGGFTVFAERLADELGFSIARANVLGVEGDVLTGEVVPPIVTADTKIATLRELAETCELDMAETMAVGDGANDSLMVEAAGLGVAYKAKPALREVADAILDHSDLTALLALQGLGAAS